MAGKNLEHLLLEYRYFEAFQFIYLVCLFCKVQKSCSPFGGAEGRYGRNWAETGSFTSHAHLHSLNKPGTFCMQIAHGMTAIFAFADGLSKPLEVLENRRGGEKPLLTDSRGAVYTRGEVVAPFIR